MTTHDAVNGLVVFGAVVADATARFSQGGMTVPEYLATLERQGFTKAQALDETRRVIKMAGTGGQEP